MSDVAGVELLPNVVRVVLLNRWRSKPRATLELNWEPTHPEELVQQLEVKLGPTRRIALAIGLGFLHPKHVNLPPAPAAERRRILTLEPDRFFPVQGKKLAVSLANEADFAFAMDAEFLERWIAAFEHWAPVESVEPAPLAIARALGNAAEGTFDVPARSEERGLIEMRGGRFHSARRILGTTAEKAALTLPVDRGVQPEFLAAFGAARGIGSGLDSMLLPDAVALAMQRRRLRRLSLSAAMCVGALLLAVWSLDRARERQVDRIAQELAVTRPRAQQAVALHDRLAAIGRESAAITEVARRRPDPLQILAAVSGRLPAGATVLSIHANGAEWQIDGTARDAAEIVPLLDKDKRFEGVRFLSASSRFREGNKTYETFSIAFRARSGA